MLKEQINYPSEAIEFDTIDDWYADCQWIKARIYVGRVDGKKIIVEKLTRICPIEGSTPSTLNQIAWNRALLKIIGQLLWDLNIYRDSNSKACYVRHGDTWYRYYKFGTLCPEFKTDRPVVSLNEGEVYKV